MLATSSTSLGLGPGLQPLGFTYLSLTDRKPRKTSTTNTRKGPTNELARNGMASAFSAWVCLLPLMFFSSVMASS